MFPGLSGKRSFAHIAHDPVCLFVWGELVALVTGKKTENVLKWEELWDFVCGTTDANDPFKMSAWNYLQLPIDHAACFDDAKDEKQLIIALIWNPRKGWKSGTPHELSLATMVEGCKWLWVFSQ